MSDDTTSRKQDHLELSLTGDVGFQSRGNGLDDWRLVHDALPEVDFDAIDLSTTFLGHRLRLPLIVSSMTGGTPDAARMNRILAEGAARAGCAMGVGSQRAALEDDAVAASFAIREVAPELPLFGNLGAVQLNYGYGLEECARAVEMIEADGIFLHLNSLQEALQPEGDRDFSGLVARVAEICRDAPFPVLLKTTGNGISRRTAAKLVGMPLAGLEVSGAGGTSWARIEALRSGDTRARERFGDWGETTAESIRAAREVLPSLPLIASGGIRDGVDVAKALALGADVVGLARPFLQAAARGPGELEALMDRIGLELRVSCFYAGRPAAGDLRPEDLAPESTPR